MYCSKCGAEVDDEAVVCPKCGCLIAGKNLQNETIQTNTVETKSKQSGLTTAIKVFMILGTVASAVFYLIPLAWTLPMTIIYFNKVKNKEQVSTAFKVCTLLFVNLIAGILMLSENN